MKMKKLFLGILLSLAMVLGLMPGMGMTSRAEGYTPIQLGDGSADNSGLGWSYVASTHTLTLNGYNLTVSNGDSDIDYGIKYTGSDPLTINLEGENAIEGYLDYNNRYRGIKNGIYITRDTDDIAADVTFTGEGSLSIKTRTNGIAAYTNTDTNASVGNIVFSGSGEIEVVASQGNAVDTNYGTVTVISGIVTAKGKNGIDTQKGVSITGGTVNAIGTINDYGDGGIGIYTMDNISITGGTVNVSGEATGISADWDPADTITIGENVISVTISSSGKAISGKLLNKLSGKGWTNVAGTEGETTIEAVNEAKEVSETLKKIYFSSHEHNFTYTVSGATITATCGGSGTCDITEGLTLTISAPTGNLVYDGTTTYPATLSTGYNTTAFPGTYSISYKKDGSAYSGVPKDAGTYTASVTAGTGDGAKTASVGYTIAKAVPTINTAPTAGEITYGQTLANSNLTGGTASVSGDFAWKDPTVAPAVSDSQKTEYDVVFTPKDENYDKAECKVKLTVNKTAATVTKAPEVKALTYTGSSQELVTEGEATGGTMQYALGTATEATKPYTTSIPTATNAGTYSVYDNKIYTINGKNVLCSKLDGSEEKLVGTLDGYNSVDSGEKNTIAIDTFITIFENIKKCIRQYT